MAILAVVHHNDHGCWSLNLANDDSLHDAVIFLLRPGELIYAFLGKYENTAKAILKCASTFETKSFKVRICNNNTNFKVKKSSFD